jgi:hypothetical protein
MPAWSGWTAMSSPIGITSSTWDEWCARQRRILRSDQHQQGPLQESNLFGEREPARLSFVRWPPQCGRLDPA